MAFITRGDPTCRKEDCSPFDLGVLFTDLKEFSNQRKYDLYSPSRKKEEENEDLVKEFLLVGIFEIPRWSFLPSLRFLCQRMWSKLKQVR